MKWVNSFYVHVSLFTLRVRNVNNRISEFANQVIETNPMLIFFIPYLGWRRVEATIYIENIALHYLISLFL